MDEDEVQSNDVRMIVAQVESLDKLDEALASDCTKVRFGSEFCESKVPELDSLKKACALAKDSNKQLVYVSPMVSNFVLDKIESHLTYLNDEGTFDVVINDLGVLDSVKKFKNLRPCLGRQLIYIPARSPWKQITRTKVGFIAKKHLRKLFYQTSLNYSLTAQFFLRNGIRSVDVDWIPPCLPSYEVLLNRGFALSAHLYLVLVTLTRKCHTARFFGEENHGNCSKKCLKNGFLLKQDALDVNLYLLGNAVFRFEEPALKDLKNMSRKGMNFIITVDAGPKWGKKEGINSLARALKS